MSVIKKVAIFGAAGNFGTPITAALTRAGFEVTIITRIESESTFPDGIPVVRTEYTVEKLTAALSGQDAAISVIGPGGLHAQIALIDAAEAAGVKRFIVDDFGWGPKFNSLPEFREIGAQRKVTYDHAKKLCQANSNFTYTGITIGNPIDWAIKRFPLMGFDVKQRSAVIYDDGTVEFTGTTLEGIAQAVVGVLKHPDETANRHVKARSIQVCQNQLLDAFQRVSGQPWEVKRAATSDLLESGRKKHQGGVSGWILELLVYQLFGPGGRCIVASKEDSDVDLLEMKEESPDDIARKVLESVAN
ncbi:NAD(P)-binding protein [Annulohypoxylon truncatum]|uniref:NAD(P)-binding protein n=1 Tax=Annulohypoxylon truncatum TaxID=327061 RepID=UPI002007F13E|nr:NAD(P)-binding protein [Annulohypoxylon truncatum]KAI1205418.1 NAD(P)-binding protein [Annulohypoxylon truncatum]